MKELKVTGMSCGHCEVAVARALETVPGVTQVVRVDHADGVAVIDGSADTDALVAAIKEAGYEASE